MRLKDRVALITGAGSGMGKAASILFGREGAKVVVVDRKVRDGCRTVKEIEMEGAEAIFIQADVSIASEVKMMFKETIEKFKALNILYNNAALFLSGVDGAATELEEKIWDQIINVNLKSVFLCCKYGIPYMIKSGGGSVINVSSGSAIKGFPGADAYTASKGGVIALTRSLAMEYASMQIRVNCIIPGTIDTPMIRNAEESPNYNAQKFREMSPLKRFGKPEEVASMALFLASDEASYAIGGAFVVDGGMSIS
jgi:NAD(P)-dependent dehydrogenase (short-subunit alcohol dehydrogenase family)